jgi:hypothetical protein
MMNRIALIVAVTTVALAGCATRDMEGSASLPAEATEGLVEAHAPAPSNAGEAPAPRKLIQNAELHVEVAAYPKARRRLDALLASVGGFVADAQIDHRDGEVSRASLTLRVPSDKLAVFLAEAAGNGKILHERLSAQDITDSYYDIHARLANAKRLEARLVEIVGASATTMKDLLEVERELARVREEIERHEGRIRLWDQQVALSTVVLELVTTQTYAAAVPATLSERMRNTLDDSFGALLRFGKGIVLLLTALVPWLLPLGLAAFGIRAVARRLPRRRPPSGYAPVPSPPAS